MRLAQRLALWTVRTKFSILSALSKKRAGRSAYQLFCTPQSRNRKKLPRIFRDAERLSFSLDGVTVRGYRWNREAPEKLLILHGYESSVINFDRYVRPLIRKGYCVLAFDAPGHGRSGGRRINVLQYKKMMKEVHTRFGPVRSFIAHSFGGLALSLYLEETPHDPSWKAVLIAPATETLRAANTFFRILKLDKGVRAAFDHHIKEVSGRQVDWFSVVRAAQHIQAQVLFFQDRQDPLTPYDDVEPLMALRLPNFNFEISDGLGHSRIYRDNGTFKKILSFF